MGRFRPSFTRGNKTTLFPSRQSSSRTADARPRSAGRTRPKLLAHANDVSEFYRPRGHLGSVYTAERKATGYPTGRVRAGPPMLDLDRLDGPLQNCSLTPTMSANFFVNGAISAEFYPRKQNHPLPLPAEFEPDRRCSTSIGWTDPPKTARSRERCQRILSSSGSFRVSIHRGKKSNWLPYRQSSSRTADARPRSAGRTPPKLLAHANDVSEFFC